MMQNATLEFAKRTLKALEGDNSLKSQLMAYQTIRKRVQMDIHPCYYELGKLILNWDQHRKHPYFKDQDHVQDYLMEPLDIVETRETVFKREIQFLQRSNRLIKDESFLRDEATIAVINRDYEFAEKLVRALNSGARWFLYGEDQVTTIQDVDTLISLVKTGRIVLPWRNMDPPRFNEYLAAWESGSLDITGCAWGYITSFRCGALCFDLTEKCRNGVMRIEVTCSGPVEVADLRQLETTWLRGTILAGNPEKIQTKIALILSSQIASVEEYASEELLSKALKEVHIS